MRKQLVKSRDQIYDGINPCTSITVHETANTKPTANAANHADLQSDGNVRQASWHITVDDTEAVRSYPDTAQCWHGGTKEANETSIAVEICVNSDGDYNKAFKRAAGVVKDLRAKHRIPRSKVFDHAHWTGKDCPQKMRAAGRWKEFLDLTEPNKKENTLSGIRTIAQAIAWSKTQKSGFKGLCLVFVRSCYGIDVLFPSAAAAWAGAKKKHHTNSLANVPVGAPVFFHIPTNAYGHVALYLGGGLFRTNYSAKGTVITAGLDHAVFRGMTMLGWSEDLNGVTIDELTEAAEVKPSGKPSKPSGSSGKGDSIVDYLVSKKQDASFANRKKLAAKHGIKNYTGTAAQNKALLKALRGGDGSKPSKSIAQMADEVIAGKHGAGHAQRRKSLGVSAGTYEKVRAEVNRRAGVTSGKSISQMAKEVIAGKHGTGHAARQKSLGVSSATYDKVRAEVNRRA